jgi:hypothetical protein
MQQIFFIKNSKHELTSTNDRGLTHSMFQKTTGSEAIKYLRHHNHELNLYQLLNLYHIRVHEWFNPKSGNTEQFDWKHLLIARGERKKKVLVVVFTAIIINYLNLHQEHNNKFSQKEGTF